MDAHARENKNKLSKLIFRCWWDFELKSELIADPIAVLRRETIEIPRGASVTVLEDTSTTTHFHIIAERADIDDSNLNPGEQFYFEFIKLIWKDAALKTKLLAHPLKTLRDSGFKFDSPATEYKIIEDKKDHINIIIPLCPFNTQRIGPSILESNLESVSAITHKVTGTGTTTGSTGGCLK